MDREYLREDQIHQIHTVGAQSLLFPSLHPPAKRASAGSASHSRLQLLRPPCTARRKGTGAERAKQKIISALSARPAPPRPARPRSQKGIVGPPWPPPEPSGAEARAALLLGPDRAGPRTSRLRLRAAGCGRGGPGPRRLPRSALPRSLARWFPERSGRGRRVSRFRFLPYDCFRRSPGPGLRPFLWASRQTRAGRTDCVGAHGRACFSFTPPLRTVFSPQSKAADLGARLERLNAFLEVTQPVRKSLPVIG